MDFDTSRTLAGIGSIILAVSIPLLFIPLAGLVLLVIGLVLFLIGLWGLSRIYNEKRILNNALYAVIVYSVGTGLAILLFIEAAMIGPGEALSRMVKAPLGGFASDVAATYVFAAFLILVATLVATGVFLWRSFSLLAEKSGESLFSIAGILILVGIVFAGSILVSIAYILAGIKFFKMKPPQQPVQQGPQQPSSQPPTIQAFPSTPRLSQAQQSSMVSH